MMRHVAVVHAMQLQKIRRNKITDKVDFKRNSLFACLTSRHVVFCWLFVTATCLPDIIPSSVSHSVCQLIPLALWRPSSPCTACFIPPFISDLARLELPCALLNNGYVVLCHRSISMVLMVLKRRKHADRHKKRGDVWCLRKAFGYTRVIEQVWNFCNTFFLLLSESISFKSVILKRNTIQVLSLSKSNKSSVCLLQAIIMPGFCNNADTAGFQYFISQLRTENLIIRSRWFAWAFKENSFHSQSLLLYVHRNGGLAYIKIPLPVSGGITRELSHEWGHVSCFLWRQL